MGIGNRGDLVRDLEEQELRNENKVLRAENERLRALCHGYEITIFLRNLDDFEKESAKKKLIARGKP